MNFGTIPVTGTWQSLEDLLQKASKIPSTFNPLATYSFQNNNSRDTFAFWIGNSIPDDDATGAIMPLFCDWRQITGNLYIRTVSGKPLNLETWAEVLP